MRWEDGSPVKRSEIRRVLALAAVAKGYPRERLGAHSLRVGGATALWVSSGGNADLVKRLGRWKSDAVDRYLWVLPTAPGGITQGMLSAVTDVPWGAIQREVYTE